MTDTQSSPNPTNRWRRRLLIMSPAMVILIGILLVNWLAFAPPPPAIAPESATTIPTTGSRNQAVAATTPQITVTAVPLAIIVEPTPTTLPTIPATAAISLLGPPTDSLLPASSTVILYWTWPHSLAETQQFVVYLVDDSGETAVGTLTEPNLGQTYRLTLPPDNLPSAETITWYVELQLSDSGDVLAASQKRTFRQPTSSE